MLSRCMSLALSEQFIKGMVNFASTPHDDAPVISGRKTFLVPRQVIMPRYYLPHHGDTQLVLLGDLPSCQWSHHPGAYMEGLRAFYASLRVKHISAGCLGVSWLELTCLAETAGCVTPASPFYALGSAPAFAGSPTLKTSLHQFIRISRALVYGCGNADRINLFRTPVAKGVRLKLLMHVHYHRHYFYLCLSPLLRPATVSLYSTYLVQPHQSFCSRI